jgi:hypothetical protein
MRRVSAILLVAMAAAMVLAGPPVASARGGVRIGVGVNLHLDRISLDGFLVCDDESATPAARVRRVELLATPSAGDYVDRITAAARVAGVLSRIGLHHWWRHVTAPFTSAED